MQNFAKFPRLLNFYSLNYEILGKFLGLSHQIVRFSNHFYNIFARFSNFQKKFSKGTSPSKSTRLRFQNIWF